MPGRVADLLEIVVLAAGAHALLRRRRAPLSLRRVFHAEEDLLELHHAGVREQQRRIVGGHERRARANRRGRCARNTARNRERISEASISVNISPAQDRAYGVRRAALRRRRCAAANARSVGRLAVGRPQVTDLRTTPTLALCRRCRSRAARGRRRAAASASRRRPWSACAASCARRARSRPLRPRLPRRTPRRSRRPRPRERRRAWSSSCCNAPARQARRRALWSA